MVISEEKFSAEGLRYLYLFLMGIIAAAAILLYGLGLFEKMEDKAAYARMLMLGSWWMVAVGAITFGAAYILVAFVLGIAKGSAQPLTPRQRVVFWAAILFALIHSFRLAYGGNLPRDFVVIFLEDFLGIVLSLALTSLGPIREKVYCREVRH